MRAERLVEQRSVNVIIESDQLLALYSLEWAWQAGRSDFSQVTSIERDEKMTTPLPNRAGTVNRVGVFSAGLHVKRAPINRPSAECCCIIFYFFFLVHSLAGKARCTITDVSVNVKKRPGVFCSICGDNETCRVQ